MIVLLKRELNNFLNSLIGIIVISVFLIINGLFLWVFPGAYNIFEGGYASLQPLFDLAPYVFLFIIPAITMRFFADEIKSGTIEMLLTKPLTDTQIVLSKWLAGCLLTLLAIIPTLVYYATVSAYAYAPGVDHGGTLGSYLGLLMLCCAFIAIGLFASSLTDNQIISFVLAFFISGFFFIGFEMIHSLGVMGQASLFMQGLGILDHYQSMSRGVIDSRDVLYFLGLILFFLLLTRIRLESRKWGGKTLPSNGKKPVQDLRKKHMIGLGLGLLLIVMINLLGYIKFVRLDLTAEKRHTLTHATRSILQELDDVVYIRVYLEGDFPAGFRRLRNQTREILDEFRAYTNSIQYEFVNPSKVGDSRQVQDYYNELISKGLEPAQIQIRADDASSQQVIFPGAIIRYDGKEIAVPLLQDQMGLPLEEVLNHSAQLLEYAFISHIRQITTTDRATIAMLEGKDGPHPEEMADLVSTLRQYYDVVGVETEQGLSAFSDIQTLIIAKPSIPFTEQDKFIIDQFIMHGGSVLWLVEAVLASMDSLQFPNQETLGIARSINLEDMLFRYGARINDNLLMDLRSAPIAVTTGGFADRPQISLVPWPFFPLLSPASNHPIVRNINFVRSEFVSSIDTIEVDHVDKTLLLSTSPYTRTVAVPALIDLRLLQQAPDESRYAGPPAHTALLLEGQFESLFNNRMNPGVSIPQNWSIRNNSLPTAMIVVADGDIIRNQFTSSGQPLPLGYDRFSGETFGNKEFLVNSINYLTDDSGIMTARNREVRLRMLDRTSLQHDKTYVQLVNLVTPLLFILLLGLSKMIMRKVRYARKKVDHRQQDTSK